MAPAGTGLAAVPVNALPKVLVHRLLDRIYEPTNNYTHLENAPLNQPYAPDPTTPTPSSIQQPTLPSPPNPPLP